MTTAISTSRVDCDDNSTATFVVEAPSTLRTATSLVRRLMAREAMPKTPRQAISTRNPVTQRNRLMVMAWHNGSARRYGRRESDS